MTSISDLSVAQLKRAVQIKEQIEKLESELSAVFGSSSSRQTAPAKGGMSEVTKNKLRAAAKARWAKVNAGKQSPPAAKTSATPARKPMSAAARARLSALMKAKWVAKNKGSKPVAAPAAKAAPKKTTMSPAARKKISEAAKARWATAKASGKKSL